MEGSVEVVEVDARGDEEREKIDEGPTREAARRWMG